METYTSDAPFQMQATTYYMLSIWHTDETPEAP
jgi:hypothetical protein